jgi:hypothetical protein
LRPNNQRQADARKTLSIKGKFARVPRSFQKVDVSSGEAVGIYFPPDAAEQNIAAARDSLRSVSQTESYLTIAGPFEVLFLAALRFSILKAGQ